MHDIVIIGIGIVVAAFIGGITNHLAIKMLFHPRQAWHIGNKRIPFTPGLIPKRRDEIGRSLGTVVAEYLVTSDSIIELLRQPSFQRAIEKKLNDHLHRVAATEQTIGGAVSLIWPEEVRREKQEQLVKSSADFLGEWSKRGLQWIWEEKGVSKLPVSDILPSWSEEERSALIQRGATYIAEAARKELYTINGERLLLKLTTKLLEQAGGFLGAMASIFMDEHKVAGKVREALSDALAGQPVRLALEQFIRARMVDAEQMTLGEIAVLISGKEDDAAMLQRIAESLNWERWIRQGSELRMDELLSSQMEWLEQRIPGVVSFSLRMLERNIERIFSTLRLEELVEAQVRDFPIERLEQVILSVSGKEFRAITWLGALLGGMIGLVQALLLRWLS